MPSGLKGDEFMFRLTREEVDELVRCKNFTSREDNYFKVQSGGSRYLPNAFTEQGLFEFLNNPDSVKKCKTSADGNTPEKDGDGNPIENENGTWFVFAHQAFSTEEWMKVTIGGVAYEIVVTDDSAFSGGDGSQGNPYKISSITDLVQLSDDVNGGNTYSGKYFQLTKDVNFNDDNTRKPTSTWNDTASTESNFTRIGTTQKEFAGHFDGNNKTISGIRIYYGDSSNAPTGLFGQISSDASVCNLTLADSRIMSKKEYVGGIVGYSYGTIENCHASSTVGVFSNVGYLYYYGGIVGYGDKSTMITAARWYSRPGQSWRSGCEERGKDTGSISLWKGGRAARFFVFFQENY